MSKQNFSERKRARRYAMQGLYSWALTGNALQDVELHMIEQAPKKFEVDYFKELLFGVPAQLSLIAEILTPFLNNRTVDELDPIELAILRIATFELKNRLDIPYKVVINEALDLTKTFGSIEGYKFVNGVLDKVAKKLRAAEIN